MSGWIDWKARALNAEREVRVMEEEWLSTRAERDAIARLDGGTHEDAG